MEGDQQPPRRDVVGEGPPTRSTGSAGTSESVWASPTRAGLSRSTSTTSPGNTTDWRPKARNQLAVPSRKRA